MAPHSVERIRDSLEAFFEAENSRDWQRYATFLHPDVVWTLVDGTTESKAVGRDGYLSAIQHAYDGVPTTFRCVDMIIDPSRSRASSLLIDDTGERSLDVFDLDGGLIRREWEFLLGRE